MGQRGDNAVSGPRSVIYLSSESAQLLHDPCN